MKAVDLSLAHKLYRVDMDSITEAEIDSLIMYENRKQIRVTFFGDKRLYFPKVGAKNINELYYFSLEEAEEAQKKKRLDALKKADEAYRKKREKLLMLQKIYND